MESNELLKKHGIQGGLLFGALATLVMFLMSFFNSQESAIATIVSLALSIGIVAWACFQFKNENDAFFSTGEGIKIGLIVGTIGGLIYAVYTYLHFELIFTDEIASIREKAFDELEKQIERGDLSSTEEISVAKKAVEVFTSSFVFATINLITQVIKGFIFGLGCGLIFRSKD